jgi:F0F1-type ATP synthase membrane subunit b/b'
VLEQIINNWWHIPILMAMMLVYGWLLNKVFFRPIQTVMAERKKRIRESAMLSESSKESLKSRLQEYEQAVLEAHRRGTHIKEEARNKAYEYRSGVLGEVRSEIEGELRKSEDSLRKNVSDVKASLEKEVPSFARSIAKKILGREVGA